ncbi:MAG: glycosyltransferase family 4 protein [Halieaceae bacterium]
MSHLSCTDIDGGAARAAYRIHKALRRNSVESTMLVNQTSIGDWTVRGPEKKWRKLWAELRGPIGRIPNRLLRTSNNAPRSPSLLPSCWPKTINSSSADLVNIHWVQDEMLSIADFGRIEKPIVWTLHDMWAFCGAEHYSEDFRWRNGYRRDNRPASESGFDLNRWTWLRKLKHWRHPVHIVTPSRWLAECASTSALMGDWPVSVIPNCVDTKLWRPLEQGLAREVLGLPTSVPLLLFGAMGGADDPRKGFSLFAGALDYLRGKIPDLELVVFGEMAPRSPPDLGFPLHYIGHLHDDYSLRLIYSAVDAMVIPSLQDNLPNTALEAHACGTPIVAFNIGGMPDVVDHKTTGYLSEAFDREDLATGIQWVLDSSTGEQLRLNSRRKAEDSFSQDRVAKQYIELYRKVLSG